MSIVGRVLWNRVVIVSEGGLTHQKANHAYGKNHGWGERMVFTQPMDQRRDSQGNGNDHKRPLGGLTPQNSEPSDAP